MDGDDLKPAIYRMFHEVDEIKDKLLLLSVERYGVSKSHNDQSSSDEDVVSKVCIVFTSNFLVSNVENQMTK